MTTSEPISFHAGAVTIVGQVRTANEDAVMSTPNVVGVADGMGGHAAGEVASAEAVRVLQFAVDYRRLDELVAAVHYANRSIFERASEDRALEGMGTTVCTAGVLVDDETSHEDNAVGILNVGDSRAYLFAAGELQQLTEDHSYVASLVRSGAISPEDAENHPRRNVVTRALGIEPLVTIDTWILSPRQGDRVLLCSDGLTNEVRDEQIRDVLAKVADPQSAAEQLAQLADSNGGRDNISVVIADIVGPLDHGEPPGERCRRFATPAVDPDILDVPDDEVRPDSDAYDNRLATLEHPIVVPTADGSSNNTGLGDAAVMMTDSERAVVDEIPTGEVPRAVDSNDLDDADDPSGQTPDEASESDPGVIAGHDAVSTDAEAVQHDDDNRDDDPLDHATDSVESIDSPKRSWWRIIIFVVAVFGLLGAGLWLVWANNQSGWWVKDDDGVVALFEGDPAGFLWIASEPVEQFDIDIDELETQAQLRLEEGIRHDTRTEAETYISNLSPTTTTTTITTTSTTSTTSTTITTTTLSTTTTATTPDATAETDAGEADAAPLNVPEVAE